MFSYLPGWTSLTAVARIHSTLEVSGIICLALLVFTEVGAHIYGNRKDQLVTVEAEKKIGNLEEKLRPRSITSEQEQEMLDLLKKVPKSQIKIQSVAGDEEAYLLAKRINEIFAKAGWLVTFEAGRSITVGTPRRGIVVRGSEQVKKSIEMIGGKIQSFGLEITGELSNQASIDIMVEPK